VREVLREGEVRETRNGMVRGLFGRRMTFDLARGFPLLTTKRVFWKGIVEELLWMLRGETNVRSLQAKGVHIWDKWADDDGELGPIYGAQWRDWGQGVDQIAAVVEGLRHDPYSRRHVVSAWNVSELWMMALPPCHALVQWYVTTEGRLDCQLYQRSADLFVGVPFNIASYALLTSMLAHVTDKTPGIFTHVMGDVHLYESHREAAQLQLERFPRLPPALCLDGPVDTVDGWQNEEIMLRGYDPHPAIPGEVAK
jgi:thymidylate synthase